MSNPEYPLEPVEPAAPIAGYQGGKRNLAARIIERIEAISHRCYAEPFVGMGGVLLRRRSRSQSETVNDINGDIVNLFRVLREHPDELARQFRWTLHSREEFGRLLSTPADVMTDVQRAARFAYLQRLSLVGKIPARLRRHDARFDPRGRPRIRADRMRDLISAAHTRLQDVHIERREWDDFIRRYDRPDTLFYIDPPYWGHETDYGKGLFARADFARMARVLRGIKGRFILSLNDRTEVRATFVGFDFEEVRTSWSMRAQGRTAVGELLISN